MRFPNIEAWRQFLSDVHAGLDARRIDPDYFSVDDLLHLHRCGYTVQRVLDLAIANHGPIGGPHDETP